MAMCGVGSLLFPTFVLLFGLSVHGVPASSLPHAHGVLRNNKFSLPHPSSSSPSAQYDVKYFTQTLDHFSFTPHSYVTFQQKYLINSKHWGGVASNSPIFVYAGNEGYIEWFTQNTGFMFDIAPEFKALLVFIEHRYYGDSMPYGSQDVAYSNATTMGYLSASQALADFAVLITDLKKNLTAEDSPVVVFGGSYGGMLAAWFRLKYPHIAIGALASSAPILAFDLIVDPAGFDNIVSNDFRSESENCYNVIKKSWKILDKKLSTPSGRRSIKESFKLCKDSDVDGLGNWLNTAYFEAAEVDYPTPSNFTQNLPAYPIKQMCRAIDNPSSGTNILSQLYGAANIYYNYTGNLNCFDLGGSDAHGRSGWDFQYCTEMVQPFADDPIESMFPESTFNYTETIQSCNDTNGIEPRPHWITTEFGGHNIKRVLKRFGSNIIFSNGLRDPWSNGGVLEGINESIIAITIKKGGHHVDLRFATTEDPKWLVQVRKEEIRIIKRWLMQYYKDLHATKILLDYNKSLLDYNKKKYSVHF